MNLFQVMSMVAKADPEPISKIILLSICVPLIVYYGQKKIDEWEEE